MSDHVDGPRSIGDPAADITDLFAFTSPENPARTVLAMCVFPSAGEDAIFSNVIDHSIVVRRVTVAGVGNAAKFQPADDEIRFSFRFEVLQRDAAGNVSPARRLHAAGRSQAVAHGERREGSVDTGGRFPRVRRAAFRPFLPRLGSPPRSRSFPICCSTTTCSASSSSSIRAACSIPRRARCSARSPRPSPSRNRRTLIGHPVRRIDWVGRPEQTNIRLNNPAMAGIDDLRDLWNQQTPFAIPKALQPLFLQRLKDSFADLGHARRQGRLDAGSARRQRECLPRRFSAVRRRQADHRRKPPRDREEHDQRPSLPDGRRPHGRRELDRHPAHLARQPRSRVPPGRRDRGDEARHDSVSVLRDAEHGAADRCRIRRACGDARRGMVGDRTVQPRLASAGRESPLDRHGDRSAPHDRKRATAGKSSNASKRSTTRSDSIATRSIAGIPASHYTGTLEVKPKGSGSVAEWRVQFLANNQPDIVVRTMVSTLHQDGSRKSEAPLRSSGVSAHRGA